MRSIKLHKLLDLVGIIPSLDLIDLHLTSPSGMSAIATSVVSSIESNEGIIPTKSKSLCNFIDLI